MHYMMLSHDPAKSPGHYRAGPIYVRDDRRDQVVYEGPDASLVPALMEALVDSLRTGRSRTAVGPAARLCATPTYGCGPSSASRHSRAGRL